MFRPLMSAGCGAAKILETELDVGQQLGNDYEQSKIAAEKEVLAADFDRVTVYRPSIIVGDSQTGYTTSYHGFYTPLRLAWSLARSIPWEVMLRSDWLGNLGLTGNEGKNLVSVEWVSAAMTEIIGEPGGARLDLPSHESSPGHGRVDGRGDGRHAGRAGAPTAVAAQGGGDRYRFSGHLPRPDGRLPLVLERRPAIRFEPYAGRARHLPCPEIDRAVMDRLTRFAIAANFGWPRETPLVAAPT